MPDALDKLARTAWGEARGEGEQGIQAVVNVIMNRAAKPSWWGIDVISVCTKPWQFSCWNFTDPNREKLIAVTTDDPQFATCLRIATNAINGDLDDITNGADSYYDRRMAKPPKWAFNYDQAGAATTLKVPLVTIGHHVFYRVG